MTQDLEYDFQDVMESVVDLGLFSSVCTIQRPDGELIGAGQPSGVFVNIAGCENIPCTAPPESVSSIRARQNKQAGEIQSFAPLHVLLSSWYPILTDGAMVGWQAVIDGTTYDLLGAESDSQRQMTRLSVRLSGV